MGPESKTEKWLYAHVGHSGPECLIWPFGRDGPGYARAKAKGFTTRLPKARDGTCSACKWWKDAKRPAKHLMPDGTCTNMEATLGAHIGTGRFATCKHYAALEKTP